MDPERIELLRKVALLDLANIADSVTTLRDQVEGGLLDEEMFAGIRDVREKIIHL